MNGQDSLSLSEMIDCDIKCEPDSGDSSISNYFGLGYDLPAVDFEEDSTHMWMQSYTGNSNSSFELDFFGDAGSALMVNPNSVMPFVTRGMKKEKIEDEKPSSPVNSVANNVTSVLNNNVLETKKQTTIVTPIKTIVPTSLQQPTRAENVTKPVSNSDASYTNATSMVSTSKAVQLLQGHQSKKFALNKRQGFRTEDVRVYPKPAYSYSCLIAMALKNSRSGSLPVSEIYNFMCNHFPYFKTAPNGWKNSVRHNLSLNKCFEKIEKPPGPGGCGAQRKGCLWAMNPAKIAKMDDEVAKWSRKDPLAIKNAMIYPENLELLERGELKVGSANPEEDETEDAEDTEEDKDTKYQDEEEEEEEEEDEEEEGVADDEELSTIDDDDSDDEITKVPPSLQPFEPRLAHLSSMNSVKVNRNCVDKNNTNIEELDLDLEVEVADEFYDELESSDTRILLGLDDNFPVLQSDSDEDETVIKRPRIQGNYLCQPVTEVQQHNVNGLRTIRVHNP